MGRQSENTDPESQDLICAWKLDGHGGGQRLDLSGLREGWRTGDECLWAHLDYTAPATQEWMRESSGLSELTIAALLQTETRPRCVPADGGLMIFLRGVNLNPRSDPEDMVSIRLWVSDNRIISLRKRRLLSVDDIRQSIEHGVGPVTSGDFIVTLVDRLLDRASTVIDELYDNVDALEDSILIASDHVQREHISDIRRQAISMRRFLAPQREALTRLSTERASLLNDKDRLFLREDADRLTRMVEDLDAARERAAVAHESLISRIAEQTNTRMYLLSIIAAIFLPLSFVTGLLGINVGGIPGADSALGFPAVILLMIFIAAGLWAFFRWRRWF
jgi:zinc transporter